MKNIIDILISPVTTIFDAMRIIDASTLQVALVVDEGRRLLGTITDGDIRRGILRELSMDQPVHKIMNPDPVIAREHHDYHTILAMFQGKRIHHIPVVDDNMRVIRLEILDDFLQKQKRDNWVVLMAGGLGSRLDHLTRACPKPLLKVGDKPLLETILENFIEHGFWQFYLSVNYKADMIVDYFGDGSRWGIKINYLKEDRPMGTAGSLGLLPERPPGPVLVMNGDLLTKVNFKQLLEFHLENKGQATLCVREYKLQVPYGVVKIENNRLLDIDEKPVKTFFVNAGIYVLEPRAVGLVPPDARYDMPQLFDRLIQDNQESAVFPIREYWIDIGQQGDFEKANGDYSEVFK